MSCAKYKTLLVLQKADLHSYPAILHLYVQYRKIPLLPSNEEMIPHNVPWA